MFSIRWDNKLNNKFNRPTKHHLPNHRRTTDNECNESKSCYFLVSVFIAPICKFCVCVCVWVSPVVGVVLCFFSVVGISKSLSKSKMNFSFALLRRTKQDNKMEKKCKRKKRAETSNEQRKRFVKYFYKLKRYENNGVIYCMWELISVTCASCAPFASLEYVCNNCQIFFRSYQIFSNEHKKN